MSSHNVQGIAFSDSINSQTWSYVYPHSFPGIWDILKQNWQTGMVYLMDCMFLKPITSHQLDDLTIGNSVWQQSVETQIIHVSGKKTKTKQHRSSIVNIIDQPTYSGSLQRNETINGSDQVGLRFCLHHHHPENHQHRKCSSTSVCFGLWQPICIIFNVACTFRIHSNACSELQNSWCKLVVHAFEPVTFWSGFILLPSGYIGPHFDWQSLLQ